MQCDYFDAGRCRSCGLMGTPYAEQLAAQHQAAVAAVSAHGGHGGHGGRPARPRWEAPYAGPEQGFRNKAKMVVGGSVAQPTLGILDRARHGVDLRDCGLHEPALHAALPALSDFVARAALTPYDVPARRGELKHVLATVSPDGELMVRWVLRTTEALPRIRKHLGWLRDRLPALVVASVNLQPEHKAVLEGPEELLLTEQEALPMRLAGLELRLRPQGFFQTNSAVAAALYEQAGAWLTALAGRDSGGVRTAWDLYSGVGGFALTAARAGVADVVGVEVVEAAVVAARDSARRCGLDRVRFATGDATAWVVRAVETGPTPGLVVVNPPRRGLGAALATALERSGVEHVLYSSCDLRSLTQDLAQMPSLVPVRARVFDMFPQTEHGEVLVLLSRAGVRRRTAVLAGSRGG